MHCSNSPGLTKQFNNISRCTSVLASVCLEELTLIVLLIASRWAYSNTLFKTIVVDNLHCDKKTIDAKNISSVKRWAIYTYTSLRQIVLKVTYMFSAYLYRWINVKRVRGRIHNYSFLSLLINISAF